MALRQNGIRTARDISDFERGIRCSTAVPNTAHTDRSRNCPGLLHADRHATRLFCSPQGFWKGHHFTIAGRTPCLLLKCKIKNRLSIVMDPKAHFKIYSFCFFDSPFIKSCVQVAVPFLLLHQHPQFYVCLHKRYHVKCYTEKENFHINTMVIYWIEKYFNHMQHVGDLEKGTSLDFVIIYLALSEVELCFPWLVVLFSCWACLDCCGAFLLVLLWLLANSTCSSCPFTDRSWRAVRACSAVWGSV